MLLLSPKHQTVKFLLTIFDVLFKAGIGKMNISMQILPLPPSRPTNKMMYQTYTHIQIMHEMNSLEPQAQNLYVEATAEPAFHFLNWLCSVCRCRQWLNFFIRSPTLSQAFTSFDSDVFYVHFHV